MLRHVTMVLAAVAMAALFVPGEASARGGGGGGFHGGGFHGGFHGGGFHHHGFGFAPGFAIGFGLGAPYGYYGYPPYDDVYDDGYDGGCYLVRRRVLTHYGWRRRTVQVCN